MTHFGFSRIVGNFGNNDSSSASKKRAETQRQGRTCRIEELEGREMLSVTPWALAADGFATYDVVQPYDSDSAAVCNLLPAVSAPPALAPLAAAPAGYNTNDWTKVETAKANNGLKDEHVTWTEINGERRLTEISAIYVGLTGNLDMSNCTELTVLDIQCNQLTGLDVSGSTALQILFCDHNKLTTLDVSMNTALTSLACYANKLTALNVSNNTALTTLMCCGNKQLTALDVSNNTALRTLYCSTLQLTELDVSMNTALMALACQDNQLTSLDVSNNTALRYLACWDNQLTFSTLPPVSGYYDYGLPVIIYHYGPHSPYSTQATVPIMFDSSNAIDLSSEYEIDGVKTEYVWKYADGTVVASDLYTNTDGKFTFNADFAGSGLYCEMTNVQFPDLTLQTTTVTIEDTVTMPPTRPTGLNCIDKTANSISLKWSSVNDATGYEIQWRLSGEEMWTPWTGNPTTNKSATVSGLTADIEFEFQVRAVDGDRVSEWSNSVIERTHKEAPSIPGDVHVTDTTDDSITLTWNGVVGATGYEIRYRIIYNSGSGQWSSENIAFTDNTAVISGLTSDTEYEFQVRAIRGGPGNAGWSTGVLAKTDGTYEIPRKLTATSEVLLPPGTEDLNTVPASVTTQKITAGKLNAVKKGEHKPTLSSVSFSFKPNAKVSAVGSDVAFEIVVYAGKIMKTSQSIGTIKISADGTVLDDGGFVLANKVDLTKPLTIDGLTASTKYTFCVKSVAKIDAGHMVESRVSKVCISTMKYKTVSSLTVTNFSFDSISLQWKVNTRSARYEATDTYEIYYIDSLGNEHVLTAIAGSGPQVNGKIAVGTFERGAVGYGTVLYVRAVKVIGAELQSLTSTAMTSTEMETIVVKSQTAKVKVR